VQQTPCMQAGTDLSVGMHHVVVGVYLTMEPPMMVGVVDGVMVDAIELNGGSGQLLGDQLDDVILVGAGQSADGDLAVVDEYDGYLADLGMARLDGVGTCLYARNPCLNGGAFVWDGISVEFACVCSEPHFGSICQFTTPSR
jgi:hypothetical protein